MVALALPVLTARQDLVIVFSEEFFLHAVRPGGATPPRGLLALGIALIALLALAPAAFASTVTRSGTTITFSAAPGIANNTDFTETAPGTLRIDTSEDPAAALPADCTSEDTMAPFDNVTCTGVTAVIDNAGDNNDDQFAQGLQTIAITHNGGTGTDDLYGGEANDTLNGDDQDDFLMGRGGSDVLNGAGGDDCLAGDSNSGGGFGCGGFVDRAALRGGGPATGAADTLRGGDGDDGAFGDAGDDDVAGGNGDDFLVGGDLADTVNGDAGEDSLYGEYPFDNSSASGADTVNGGDDSDFIGEYADQFTDTVSGGNGLDTLQYSFCCDGNATIDITLDDQANDGVADADPGNNFRSDLDNVDVNTGGEAIAVRLRGHGGVNGLTSSDGPDDVDALAGVDIVNTQDGNDTVNAVDGFPDIIDCGQGTDTANVDQFDTTTGCETVNTRNVASAFGASEDRPPNVSWTSPASGAKLGTTSPSRLTLDANDDRGIAQVVVLDDERPVCVDESAPYTCDYSPRGEDVGRNTLVAVAVDTSSQTASALRAVEVDRFLPRRVSASTTPRRDTDSPFRFRTTGRVTLPAGIRTADGCTGSVSVQIKAGTRTISTRRARLSRTCTYSSRVTFRGRSRFRGRRALTFQTRFTGNEVLLPRRSARITRRVG